MTRRRAAIVLIPVAGLVALWLAPDLGRYPVADPGAVFFDSLAYSGSVIVIVLGLVAGARLASGRLGRDVGIAAVASLAFLPIGYAVFVFVNGWLDTTPETEQAVRLVGATSDGTLEVESWRGAGNTQRLPRRWQQPSAPAGSLVLLTTHAGWLGHEWLSAARVLPPMRVVATPAAEPAAAPTSEPPAAAHAPETPPLPTEMPERAAAATPAAADEPRGGGDASAGEEHRKRAYEHAMRGEFAAALDEYDRAIAAAPGNAENYYRRAMTRRGADQVEAMIADLRKTLELDPRHVAAHWDLARVYARNSQIQLSQPLIEELAALTPADAEVQWARAWHFAHLQNRAAELEALHRGCELGSQKSCERQRSIESRR